MSSYKSETHNPWFSIWVRPRDTLREVLDNHPSKRVLWLAILNGLLVGIFLWQFDVIPQTPTQFWLGILSHAIGGAIFSLIHLAIFSTLLSWTGRWLGGKGSCKDLRAAISYGYIPHIWAFLLKPFEIYFFGKVSFIWLKTGTLQNLSPEMVWLLSFFIFLELGVWVWWLVAELNCIAEAHQFSLWRALWSTVHAFLLIVVFIFAVSFVFQLIQAYLNSQLGTVS